MNKKVLLLFLSLFVCGCNNKTTDSIISSDNLVSSSSNSLTEIISFDSTANSESIYLSNDDSSISTDEATSNDSETQSVESITTSNGEESSTCESSQSENDKDYSGEIPWYS